MTLRPSVFACVFTTLLAVGTAQAGAQETGLSPEAILGVRQVDGDVQLSPDGRLVAVVIREPASVTSTETAGRSNIWMLPADGTRPLSRIPGSSGRDDTPRWSPDGHSIAFLSTRPRHGEPSGGSQLFLVSLDRGSVARLTHSRSGIDGFVWGPDGRSIAFVARDAGARPAERDATPPPPQSDGGDATVSPVIAPAARVYTVGVAGNSVREVTTGDNDVEELASSPDGKSFALLINPGPPGAAAAALTLEVVDAPTGAVRRTLSDNAAPIGGTLRWSPDGRWISFLQNSPSKFASWLAVVPAEGGAIRGVLQDDTGTVWRAEWTQTPDRLVVEEVRGTGAVLRTVDVGAGTAVDWTPVSISQGNYGFSAAGSAVAYVSETPSAPADVWIAGRGQPARRLTALNPQVAAWRLGSVQEFDWRSTEDGATVHGLLVTPPGYVPGRPYPTVVETHPGDMPWWRGWLANWWAWGQLLATHGYVVFLPNYRGVTGQGWHAHEHLADWGGLSYHDLVDGIDALIQRGVADSTRLGIGGWSNGGFMAVWAATHSTRFKAAVAKSAPTDFATLYATSAGTRPDFFIDFGGSPYERRDAYDTHSPISFVRACRTPTLLVYGEHDIVSASQGDEFYAALEAAQVPTTLVVYPREEHGLDEYRHQLDFQRRVLAWFDKYLK